jgi:HK97 family phage major capsid protein
VVALSGLETVALVGCLSNGLSNRPANSVGYSDIVNLEHSVDPSYRRGASYMFHDLTLASIKKILDKFGRPIWAPGIAVGEPDKINGYSYTINQSMPQIGPSNVTIAFGDMSKFLVRKVSGWSVQRLAELYAINGQVGFVSHMRVDSNLIANSGRALNVLQQHS